MAPDLSILQGDHKRKAVRRLTRFLFMSIACNCILGSYLFYYLMYNSPREHYPVKKSQISKIERDEAGNGSLLETMSTASLDSLLQLLMQTDDLDDGYAVRDLSLGMLVSFHYFDLERALGTETFPTQRRQLVFSIADEQKIAEVTVFPTLTEKQWEAIYAFVSDERWPLTSKGLFQLLKEDVVQDSHLIESFFVTQEFLIMKKLFCGEEGLLTHTELLQMILEGSWEQLSHCVLQQRANEQLGVGRQREFFLLYLEKGSAGAASALLMKDSLYALHKLSDLQVIDLLMLVGVADESGRQYAQQLLTSPRSDAVWEEAAKQLYLAEGEQLPRPYHHMEALRRFVPTETFREKLQNQDFIETSDQEKVDQEDLVEHVIKKGDSLWKIARKYGVSVDQLKRANGLTSNVLRPGGKLKVPSAER